MAGSAQRSDGLIVVGAGGHATSVADVAAAAGFRVKAFVDAGRSGESLLGLPIVDRIQSVETFALSQFAIAVGDNAARQRMGLELLQVFGEGRFPALIHPTANVSAYAEIACGTVVMAQASVGPRCSLGRFCIINTGSSIDHDGTMSDAASLAPGARTGGGVTIGERSAVSLGALVKHRVSIGVDVVVGAASYVNKNVPDLQVVYGTPARSVRARQRGEPYL